MERIFEQLKKVKEMLPPEKRFRVMIENDGRTPRIIIDHRTFLYDEKNPKLPLTLDEIDRIGELDFVGRMVYHKNVEEIIVSLK